MRWHPSPIAWIWPGLGGCTPPPPPCIRACLLFLNLIRTDSLILGVSPVQRPSRPGPDHFYWPQSQCMCVKHLDMDHNRWCILNIQKLMFGSLVFQLLNRLYRFSDFEMMIKLKCAWHILWFIVQKHLLIAFYLTCWKLRNRFIIK